MISNPLLLLNLFNSATNLTGNLLEGAANAIGLSDENGEVIQGDFSAFLNQVAEGGAVGEISAEVADLINAPQTEEEISALLSGSLNQEGLGQNTKAAIEQILGSQNLNKKTNGEENANLNQNVNQVVAATTATNNPLNDSNAKVIINEDQILDKKNLSTQGEIIKVDQKYINPLDKNLGLKEDERILGKDNLQSMVKGANKNISFNNNEVLGLQSQAVGNQVSIKTDSGKNLTDLKLADAVKDQQQQGQTNVVTHSNDADQSAKQDHFARVALNTRNDNPAQNTQHNANYKIVNFTKTKEGIDLQLDPASLGKVQIKFEFGADGKSTMAVIAQRAETLEILRNDSKAIQHILQENGIGADSNSLSFDLQQGGANQQEQQSAFNLNNSRRIAFNMEQDLNNNVKDISISNTSGLYRDLSGVGMLNMVV